MKKKVLIIIGIIVLIIGVLAMLPFLYKDKLLVKVKATINKQVNAKVDFKDFSVSLFSHFPKVGMELEQLSVVGINEFAGDTMMVAKSISTSISVMEMIKGENLELKTLTIDQPRINLLVDTAGRANWDIAKETGEPSAEPSADQSFQMKLNDIQINNLNLYYGDQSMPMKLWVKNTNVNSTGEVEGTLTTFDLKGDVDEIIFEYDSVKYISNTKLKVETLLKADYDKMNFAFDRGKLMINNLPLQLNGSFAMPNDSMLFDLAFQSEKSDFATILALVPADYQKYLEKATITGAAEFKGSVKGLFYNEIYPAIDVLLNVSNGSFKYQELPESVQDIQVQAKITKPEGDLNTMVVNVEKAHATIKNNPVDLTMNLSEMMTDPNIAATFAGTIDFNTLKQAIPVDSLDLTGIMKARM
ncbi:MAG TPA: AsmA family protein, partial [Prolixibacteraceae bacterium]|nr:AsmA family protein [Prolixibacteraceae bacterium]